MPSRKPLELVCVEVPKVFGQCLIKRCLKFKEGCDTKHTDEELKSNPLNNPKFFLGCRDFNIKLLSFDKIPLKCECGYNKLIINFTISFYVDFLDNCGNHCPELFEINRTETVPRLYCPNSEDAINDMLKLELVAECLDGCFTEDCNCNCVLDVTLGFFLIVKCQLVVQLLMPSYAYCPVPKPCKERPLEDPSLNCDCLDEVKHDSRCCNCAHCTPGHPTPTESLFTCGQGSGVSIPIPNDTNPTFEPIPVANVTLDTTCLCNPSVKIDFNSIINYQSLISVLIKLASPFTAIFQLSKTCKDGSKVALGTWDFAYASIAFATNVTNSFGFTYCECNICPACCVYSVEIVRVTGSVLSAAAAVTLTENASIRSSSITATATSH